MDNSLVNISIFNTYASTRCLDSDLITQITAFSEDDISALTLFVTSLNPSANSFKEIFSLLKQISTRDRQSISNILSNELISKIFTSESKLSPKDKLKILKQYLHELRYPESAKLKNQLNDLNKSILKKHGIKLSLPTQLEGDSLSFELSINSLQQLEAHAQRLMNLAKDDTLAKIFSILKGEI